VSDAILFGQNHADKFTTPPGSGINVARGMTHDGLGKYLSHVIPNSAGGVIDAVRCAKIALDRGRVR
jgi:myo-inositol-1-phosphate synthase